MHAHHFHSVHRLSPKRFRRTVVGALVVSLIIVAYTALMARATLSFSAALTDPAEPDLALFELMKDETITHIDELRKTEDTHDFLVETKHGPKFVQVKWNGQKWFVFQAESLRE